jgi:hypothetical protein
MSFNEPEDLLLNVFLATCLNINADFDEKFEDVLKSKIL